MDSRKLWPLVLALALVVLLSAGCATPTPPPPTDTPIPPAATSGNIPQVMVPMPDGVRLATTVCLPEGQGPWPALLIRTPYSRDPCEEHTDITAMGIAAVTQDTRGRFDSEGEDVGFFTDREDGQATLEWIAAPAWSNGRVATYGGSAMGIVQYLMAPGAPAVLRCQWIGSAAPDLYYAVFQGGVYRYEMVETWLQENGSAHLIEPFRAHHLNTSYWDPIQITEDYGDVHVPAVHEGGWYDIFARGTVDAFLGYQNQGGAGAAGQQHLIMGPWPHAGYPTEVGELTFPDADRVDYDLMIWLRACLLDEPGDMAAVATWPAVHYYTMGATGEVDAPGNEWRDADSWPPEGVEEVPAYLHPGNALAIEPPRADGGGDLFVYDPGDPSPTWGGANLYIEDGARDQRAIEARDDVVVYSSPTLDEPVEVTGDLRAQIWIATDVPDTDIVVRLTDVYPDGRSMLVADGIIRARYHNSPDFSSEQLLEPGEVVLLTVDLGPTSIIFNTGHRIRVSVTSSNAPRFSPNPNTGATYLEEGAVGQIAHTTILHDADHPSAIILPIK
jgi:predicted acyl esterase